MTQTPTDPRRPAGVAERLVGIARRYILVVIGMVMLMSVLSFLDLI